MAGVSLQDRVPSAVVAERCGVGQVLDVVRSRRLRWFGQVERREEARLNSVALLTNWLVRNFKN